MLNTNVGVYLSLNIQVQNDSGEPGLLTIPLISLTTLLLWWWNLQSIVRRVSSFIDKVYTWANLLQQKTSLTLTLFEISGRSLLYGAGLAV